MTPLYFVHSKSTVHKIWPSWLLSKDMIWGKPFYFVHPKFTLLCMSILTLEQILIWVLVLVLDMKVLDVLNFFKKMSTWSVLVLGIYLGYLVYLSTWSTVLDPNPDVGWVAKEYYSNYNTILTINGSAITAMYKT